MCRLRQSIYIAIKPVDISKESSKDVPNKFRSISMTRTMSLQSNYKTKPYSPTKPLLVVNGVMRMMVKPLM